MALFRNVDVWGYKADQILARFIMACELSTGTAAPFSLHPRWTIHPALWARRVAGCGAGNSRKMISYNIHANRERCMLLCSFTTTETEVQLKILCPSHLPSGCREYSSKTIPGEALMVSRKAQRSGVLPEPFGDACLVAG